MKIIKGKCSECNQENNCFEVNEILFCKSCVEDAFEEFDESKFSKE